MGRGCGVVVYEMVMIALLCFGVVCRAEATDSRTLSDEYTNQIKSAEAVAALGNDLFGDQTNLYTGATSFQVTDVSVPGNNALPVSVGRRYRVQSVGFEPLNNGLFGDWDLEIPHLQGIFASSWSSAYGKARCSAGGVPPTVVYKGATFDGQEYWSGYHAVLPGGDTQEMLTLVSENPNRPTDSKTYYWTTNNGWFFSCLPNAAAPTQEYFLAIAPDGTQYRFDVESSRKAEMLEKGSPAPALTAYPNRSK